jgi:hypothetical protein
MKQSGPRGCPWLGRLRGTADQCAFTGGRLRWAVRCEPRRYETEFAVCGARIDLGFFDARGPLGPGRPRPSFPLA